MHLEVVATIAYISQLGLKEIEKYNSVLNIQSNQELLLPFLEKFCPYLQEVIKSIN